MNERWMLTCYLIHCLLRLISALTSHTGPTSKSTIVVNKNEQLRSVPESFLVGLAHNSTPSIFFSGKVWRHWLWLTFSVYPTKVGIQGNSPLQGNVRYIPLVVSLIYRATMVKETDWGINPVFLLDLFLELGDRKWTGGYKYPTGSAG